MASASVLQEYLIKLGFKSDAASSKQFAESIKGAANTVNQLGDALKAVFVGEMAKKFVDIAESINEVYQAAIRTGSSVQGLQGIGKAFERIGSSADSATDMVKNLHRFITLVPAGETIIQQLGVQTRDLHGNLRETPKIMAELMKSMQAQARADPAQAAYIQSRGQQLFGGSFDIETVKQTDKLLAKQAEYDRMVKLSGADMNQQGKDAEGFSNGLAKIGWALEIIRDRIAGSLFKQFGIDLAGIGDWLAEHSKAISDDAIAVVQTILKFFQSVYDWLKAHKDEIWADLKKISDDVKWLAGKVRDEFNAWEPTLKKTWDWIDKLVNRFTSWQRVIEVIIGLKLAATLLSLTGIGTALSALGPALMLAWNPWFAAVALAVVGLTTAAALAAKAITTVTEGVETGPGTESVGVQLWRKYFGGGLSLSQKAFAAKYRPDAEKAAAATGMDVNVILAQAFLESAGGAHAPGNNFFGIKGPGQMLATHEVVNGQSVETMASFRAYGNAAESFMDHARLMQTGHYDAVRAAHGIDAQASALQAAHYATDPEYAAKVAGIAHAFAGLPPGDTPAAPGTPGTPVALDPARGALPGVVAAVARFQAARTALVKAQTAYARQTAGDEGTTSHALPADFTAAQTEFAAAQQQLSDAAKGKGAAPGSVNQVNSNNTTTVENHPVTTIHINADSPDPQAIAQSVGDTMNRSHGNLVRYLAAAIT